MNLEAAIEHALALDDDLARLARLVELAHVVDGYRSELAVLKSLTAASAADAGVKQTEIAEMLGVTPMLVQQWVKRGRTEMALRQRP